ncbi:MAG: T9SS C-terminal target domain-containing protein [Bacteroidia bacterium]|nr:MAG: T9SS C-terminal target domain-containing protein [Bacteroidia bacterium]
MQINLAAHSDKQNDQNIDMMTCKKIFVFLSVLFPVAFQAKALESGLEQMLLNRTFDAVIVFEEDFSDNALPDGWQNDDLSGSGHFWEFENEKTKANSDFSGSGDVHVHTALTSEAIDCSGLTVVKLGIKHRYVNWLQQNGKLEISTDGQTWTLVKEYNVTTGNTLAWEVIDISDHAAGEETVLLRWTFDDAGLYGYFWMLDEVVIYTPHEKDLNALEVSGNAAPTLGEENPFFVKIRNDGTGIQDDYLVLLYDADDILIGTQQGEPIAYDETLTFEFTWIPNEAGQTYLYGVVELDDDQIPGNNQTLPYPVNVQLYPTNAITVGNSTTTHSNVPISFSSLSSLAQTMYYPEEMGGGGLITTIAYVFHFDEPVNNTPVKIWLAETESDNLNNGWVPYDEMILVFDDDVTFPTGSHAIYFNLEEPFLYSGGNLVLMAFRPLDMWGFGGCVFNGTETPNRPNRTRRTFSNQTEVNPVNPNPGTLTNQVPQTTFFVVQTSLGSLEGNVTDPDGNPINQAHVTLEGTNFSAQTFANGSYVMQYIPEGQYDATISKAAFMSQTHQVTIVEGQTTTLNVTLEMLHEITVTGTVLREDDQETAVSNATIAFESEHSYHETTADEQGFFEVILYGNQHYDIAVSAAGYLDSNNNASFGDENHELDPFFLREYPVPVYEVHAEQAINYLHLNWPDPDNYREIPIVYDDGSAQNGFSSAPGYNLWLGNKFPVFADGMIRSIDFYGLPHPYGWENEVTIQFFDRYKSHFYTSDPFVIKPNQWNKVKLPMIPFSGEFWAMFNWDMLNTHTHHVGYDQTGPNADAQLDYFYDGSEWYLLHEVTMGDPGVFLIRVNAFIEGELIALSFKQGTLQKTRKDNFNQCKGHKILEHYKVFRRKLESEGNSFLPWDTLGVFVTAREFVDNTWGELATGSQFQYGVQAVYSFDNESVLRKSELVAKTDAPPAHQVTVSVYVEDDQAASGAEVLLSFHDPLEGIHYAGYTGNEGSVVFNNVTEGVYNLEIFYEGYDSYHDHGIDVFEDIHLNVHLGSTGLDDTLLSESLRVYPNPATTHLRIESDQVISLIQVIDLTGQTLKEYRPDADNFRINAGTLSNGIYMLRIATEQSIQHIKIKVAR